MRSRILAAVALCTACGAVNNTPPGDGAASDGTVVTPRSYHGTVPETSPAMFGGGPPPACTYTMTLRQIDVQIGVLPTGQVVSGQVQDLNVEAIVGTCQFRAADPSITNYSLMSAVPSASGTTLTFQEKAGDKPGTSLVAELSAVGTGYQAQLTFHRTDLGPPLDWTVVVIVTLSPL
jgi:hypothetical protein